MSKQRKTYVLLIAVLVVWGIIGYQFYSRWHPKNEGEELLRVSHSKFVPQPVAAETHYKIQAKYRDPFLETHYRTKKIPSKKRINREPQLPFPTVVYNGMVKGSRYTSYVLTINGKQEVFKTGQSIQDITLVKADEKGALVRFQKINKTLLLQ